jgi:hypothetical protein
MTLIAPVFAIAQTSMGGVSGTVTDSTGAVVPGASVSLTNEATGVQSTRQTSNQGYFTFVNVRPGRYVLTVELTGFNKAEVAPFSVGVNETVARNVSLKVGDVTETVVVAGQSELLQTATAELGNVIEEKVIRELPIQGRNFTQLLLLTPGVNPVSTAQGSRDEIGFGTAEGNNGLPGSAFNNASVQGQQNRSKIYYMDGIVNTSIRGGTYVALPDLESLQEFKVQSHSDKAEFGGVTGGVINMTTKSGSNQFRGSAFGFLRTEGLTARDPFRDLDRNNNPVKPPDFRQGQFGANLGGHIVKDKTFFFASYDGWRYRDSALIEHTVPTAAELNGDFSRSWHGRTIYNPFTTRIENGRLVRDPFPGNIIPANLISPTMQAFLKAYMVQPNVPGNVVNNFRANRERSNNANAYQVRIDHHFSNRDNIFLRYTERRIDQLNPIGDVGFREPDSINRNFGGGWFHTFSPSVILELRGGRASQPTADAPLNHPLGNEPQRALGLPELDRFYGYFLQGGAANVAPWNFPDLGVQGPRPRDNPNWNVAADLTWLKGKHNFKLGFQRLQINRLQQNQFGQLNFTPEATRNPQSTGNTGDSVASALLGLPSRIQGNVHEFGFIDFHTETLSGYVQDQWSIKPNLTLIYGVRYDYITRATGKGLQSGPDFDTGEWLIALPQLPPVCSAVGNVPPCLPAPINQIPFNQFIRATGEEFSILPPIRDNFGPRVGLAWQMNPRTVLRTGYSLLWDSMVSRSQYGQHQFETWGWPQFSGIDTSLINLEGGRIIRIEDVEQLPFGLPRADPWTSTGWFNDPDRKNGYSHQWHAEVQREITRNLMVAVAYVGSHNGRLEYAGRIQSPPVPAVAADGRRLTPAERDRLRPWPHIRGDFRYEDSIGWANYHAFQFKVQHRFANGLATNLSYTLSRSKDTSSGWFNTENGVGGDAAAQNFHDIDAAYGLSGYDVPHVVTWAGIWELPGPKQGGASWLVGNWQLNWNVLARSGQPMTIRAGGDPANIGFNNYAQADLVGDPKVSDPTAGRWFNTDAFRNPVNAFGNSGRGRLRGPGYWLVDFGLQKNLPIGAGRSLQLRVDVFNAFNHMNLDPAQDANFVVLGNANFGRIRDLWGRPRQVEFGARLIF